MKKWEKLLISVVLAIIIVVGFITLVHIAIVYDMEGEIAQTLLVLTLIGVISCAIYYLIGDDYD